MVAQNLKSSFFQRDVLTVARDLIGVELCWRGCSGLIVETEAYAVHDDPACHTATRPSSRDFVARHEAGTAYVYFNYGMYWLFNVLVKGGPGTQDGLILIRALEPREGVGTMQMRRDRLPVKDLCSGPGKLTIALGITGADHRTALTGPDRPDDVYLRLPSDQVLQRNHVLSDLRVGIRQAADRPWRFLLADNPHVSVPYGRVKVPAVLAPRKRAEPSLAPPEARKTKRARD